MLSTKTSLRFLFACLLLGAWPATAQQFPTVPGRSVIGRLGIPGDTGPSQAIPLATLTANLVGPQTANKVYAGPTSGVAVFPTFRALVGADLPAPGASSLGGVMSSTCSASNWFNTLSTAGAFGCSQPNFTDLAGSIAAGQIPAGTIVNAAISNSAAIALSKLATQSANTGVCNATGGAAVPTECSKTQMTALINPATASLSGAIPALANTGTKFFRDDGTYQTPPSAGTHILLATLTASASPSLNDATACGGSNCLTNAYGAYELVFTNILPATNNVSCQIQVHSGGVYPATNYLGSLAYSGTATWSVSSPTTYVGCSAPALLTNGASLGVSGQFRIYNPTSTSNYKAIVGQFFHGGTATGTPQNGSASGQWGGGTGAVDGFQVLMSSGNIASGTIKIYGIQ